MADREWLLAELDRVRARKSELAAHRQREAQLLAQLGELDAALAQHGEGPQKKALPLLDRVRVASPCAQSWADMVGDDLTRHCRSCKKDVHDLSAMTREAAEAFLQRLAGQSACVRFYQRADGTILSAGDCPVGVTKKRRRALFVAAAGFGVLGAGAAYFTLERATRTMGEMRPVAVVVQGGIRAPDEDGADAGATGELPE